MNMIATKPAGYFRRPEDEGKLQRFLRYGLALPPEGPGAIAAWDAVPGSAAGEVVIIIAALPDPMDATEYNDNAGVILDIGWSYTQPGSEEIAPIVSTLSATLPGSYTVTLPEEYHFTEVDVAIWAIATAGAGPKGSVAVIVPGAEGFGDIIPDEGIAPDDNVIPPD